MNRLHHLQQTLLRNIEDNRDYDELEFVLLDYNSQDGLEQWVKDNLQECLANGKLVYYRTNEPTKFSHSHAKNLAFRLADGSIVCNINADHYTGTGFASYINRLFADNGNIVITPIDFFKTRANHKVSRDVLGKVCVKKADFLKVNGFDERMTKYGFEDFDFVNRLEMGQVERTILDDPAFLKYIPHRDTERFSGDEVAGAMEMIAIDYCTPQSSQCIFLYRDHTFEMGTLLDNIAVHAEEYVHSYRKRTCRFEFSRKELQWQRGTWERKDDEIIVRDGTGEVFPLLKAFCFITDRKAFGRLSFFNYLLTGREIMEHNLDNRTICVNPDGFGRAMVYRNLCDDQPIII